MSVGDVASVRKDASGQGSRHAVQPHHPDQPNKRRIACDRSITTHSLRSLCHPIFVSPQGDAKISGWQCCKIRVKLNGHGKPTGQREVNRGASQNVPSGARIRLEGTELGERGQVRFGDLAEMELDGDAAKPTERSVAGDVGRIQVVDMVAKDRAVTLGTLQGTARPDDGKKFIDAHQNNGNS